MVFKVKSLIYFAVSFIDQSDTLGGIGSNQLIPIIKIVGICGFGLLRAPSVARRDIRFAGIKLIAF